MSNDLGQIPSIRPSRKLPAAARNLDAPFPVSPSGGKRGREGSPHADSTLRGQQKALARTVRRLPPQEGCRPLVNPPHGLASDEHLGTFYLARFRNFLFCVDTTSSRSTHRLLSTEIR